MSRRFNSCKKHIFLLILALQLILHVTLSNDNSFWCGKVENEATDVWIGQNFSKRFYLRDPILDNQILVWTKGNSTWVKRNASPLEYMDDGNYSHTRYRMTKASNVSFDLFIDYADQNDIGHHVVTVNLGKQSQCTALMMNLSVNTLEPICSTRLNKSDGKLQTSCQWVQINKGDRADFEVENEVLYEHSVQEVNFNGTFNVAHTFTVNIGLDRLVDEITVPPRCVVSRKRGKVREMCEFLEVRSYPLTYTQNKNVEFKCCSPILSKPLPLLYDCYGKELRKSSKRNYTTHEDNCMILFFVCGAIGDHNSNINVIKMEQMDMRRPIKYKSSTLSVGVGKTEHDNEHDNGSEDQRCEVMTVKVTSPNGTLNNQDGNSTDSDISKNCVSTHLAELVSGETPTYKPDGITAKYRHILIAMAATSASVLVFITGACSTKCYYLYNSSGKYYLVRRDTAGDPQRSPPEVEDDDAISDIAMTTFISQRDTAGDPQRSPPEAEDDDVVRDKAMTAFIFQTPKQDGDAGYQSLNFNQPPSDDEVHCFEEESTKPCSGPPSLTLGREITKHDTGGRSESVKKSSGQQSAPTACKPIPDSTHCSVDDVGDMSSKAENRESYGKNQLYPSSSVQNTIRDDWKGTSSPTQEPREVYGKSDMSRESFQIFPPPPALTTNQAYHVYENAVVSDTDKLTSGDELYINTPDPAQELHEVNGKTDMNHECFQSSHLHESFPQPPALTTNQAYHVYENAVASDTDESSSGDELYINTSVSALI